MERHISARESSTDRAEDRSAGILRSSSELPSAHGNQVFDSSQIDFPPPMDDDIDFDLTEAAGQQRRAAYKCWGGCGGFLVLFFTILLATSFTKVDYYEMGFAKRVSTGTVEREEVFEMGSYCWGPDYTITKFPKSVTNMDLIGVSVWTKASAESAGTTVTIAVSFQYKLIPDKLPDLYAQTGLNFEPLVRNLALEKVKNGAVEFSSDQYLEQRRSIEARFRVLVEEALADVFMNVVGFQLREINFPEAFRFHRLNAAIQIERNAAETYRLQTTVTRGETARMVTVLRNSKDYIVRDGQAQATLIAANAKHFSTRLYENLRTDAIGNFCDALGITANEHKLSIDFMFNVLADASSRVFMGVDDYQIHV